MVGPVSRAVYYCSVSGRDGLVRMNRTLPWIAAAALSAMASMAVAASIGDLYSVTVPVAGPGEAAQQAAFREAMRDILVRATGRRDAAELESLAPLVAQAARHVVSYRRASGSQLAVNFDGPAIENAIDAAGLPFWGTERPLTLVWLAVDHGGGRRSLLGAASTGEEKQRIDRVAARRGVPLIWPGSGDDLGRGFQHAWSGDHGPLMAAAARYGADGVLIGRATVTAAGRHTVEWTFSAAGLSAQTTGELESGPELAADRYAGAHASRGAGQRSEQFVTVRGIDSLQSFAAAMGSLSRLPLVRGLAVDEVTPDAVSFILQVRGDPAALLQSIERDGRLVAVDPSRMIFTLSP